MKRLLLLLSSPLLALVSVTSTADISGDGTAHQVAASGAARWIQFVCPSTNNSAVRLGDSTVSTTVGVPCAAGGSFFLPPIPAEGLGSQHLYDLSKIYYVVQTGDKLSITRANP
jgi:hypothetical protein